MSYLKAPAGVVNIVVADRFVSRLRGLLFRQKLGPCTGMLLSPCKAIHTAFMAYSIDVIFLDRAGYVVRVIPALGPWRAAACPHADDTLELLAGSAAALRISVGEKLERI